MLKLDAAEAYLGLDDIDIKVIEQELWELRNSVNRLKRNMRHQFFLEDKKTITLVVYWDDKEVKRYRFQNKGSL